MHSATRRGSQVVEARICFVPEQHAKAGLSHTYWGMLVRAASITQPLQTQEKN